MPFRKLDEAPDRRSPDKPSPPGKAPPVFNVPKVVLVLAGMMIGAHILFEVMPASWTNAVMTYLIFNPGHLHYFDYSPIVIGARWFGHTMVHFGWTHLLVNAAFLIAFGTPIARQIPAYSFVLLFFLGAAGGMIAVTLVYGNQEIGVFGASAAVSAMVGALARMVYIRRGAELVPPPFNDTKNGTIFVGVFFAINIAMFFLPGPGGATVSGEAHIGGFVAGFLLSLILPWARRALPGRP